MSTKLATKTPVEVVTKPQSTTGPKSGKTTRRTNPKDQGHTLVRIVGPYATKSGRFEITWTCQCGKTARPYVKDVGDLATARAGHQRHADKAMV